MTHGSTTHQVYLSVYSGCNVLKLIGFFKPKEKFQAVVMYRF